jgi:hypothetical protein
MVEPPFNTLWDKAVFFEGPAAIFIVDHKNWLKVDPERTREMWLLLGERPRTGVFHGVLTDQKTGLKVYLCATNLEFLTAQPRGSVALLPDVLSALQEVAAQFEKKAP